MNGKVECVACRRAANSAAERRRRDRRAAKALDFEITPAMRSYLAAFDAWLRAEDPFSLRRLERRRAVALGAMVADSRQRRAAG